MRQDGRKPEELRQITIERGYIQHAAGSALISFGNTRVLCAASFQERVPPWMRGKGEGWVTAEYAMLPASSPERVSRDAVKKGRALEISRLIGRSLRAITDRRAMGECMITVDCDVLQADGGTRTAAITGASIALYDALDASVRTGNITDIPLHSAAAAVSVGIVDGVPLLDLCYTEDVRAEVDMNIVMNREGQYIEVQGSAEGRPWTPEQMHLLLELGAKGIEELLILQRKAIGIA